MKLVSMGDMAQTLALRRHNLSLNSALLRLTEELATGETTTPSQHLGGDVRYLADVEHRKRTTAAYEIATSEAQGFTSMMQASLESIQTNTEALAEGLISASAGTQETWNVLSNTAADRLSGIVASLNTSFAGRTLFGGDSTNRAALVSAEDILAQVRAAASGAITVEGIKQSVDAWFASDAGFGANAYLGSDDSLAPFQLGERDAIHLDLRADAQELRSLMADVALAAISEDYDGELQQSLLEHSGLNLLEHQDDLTGLRADLGFAEARIEEIGVGLAAEKSSLGFAREALLGIDEYQTATELENVQFHLEALYTVTARLSGLSLVNYL